MEGVTLVSSGAGLSSAAGTGWPILRRSTLRMASRSVREAERLLRLQCSSTRRAASKGCATLRKAIFPT